MVLSILSGQRWFGYLRWWLVFAGCLLPLGWMIWSAVNNRLGADPAQELVLLLGLWAMRFLWMTLAVTPLRQLLGWGWLQRFRRMLGLYALFYALLHLLAFLTFILGWRADLILVELSKRYYIVAGLAALVLLIPLGITSTQGFQRRLKKNWIRLHRLSYLAAVLVLVHYLMQIRASYAEHLFYGMLLLLLLGYRVVKWQKKKNSKISATNS